MAATEVATSRVEDLDRSSVALLCAATLFYFVVAGIFMSSVPLYVARVLDGSPAAVGVAAGSFAVSSLLMRPVIGPRLDRWGRKPFLVGASALSIVCSLGFFVANSLLVVVILGLIRGVAGGTYYPGAATTATDLAPDTRRAELIAILSLFLYGGFAIGPGLGEWLIARHGFDVVWGTGAALGALALIVAACLPETMPERTADAGAGPRFGFHKDALGPGIVLMCVTVGYTGITAFSPLYARDIGMSSSGGLYATFALTILVFRLLTRKLADRHGRVQVAVPGLVAAALGLALLAGIPEPAAAYAGVGAYGFGFALLFPALVALTADRVPESERGLALTSFTAFFDVGGGLGTYGVGFVADRYGFGAAFGIPAALCVAGALLLLRYRGASRSGDGASVNGSSSPRGRGRGASHSSATPPASR